ncbi:hypothetical protein ON010_g9969 [Phytophthora cinnamomi]|nr:hypothetical protein ON010_g9969 [Phytophthora cinnamomi]
MQRKTFFSQTNTAVIPPLLLATGNVKQNESGDEDGDNDSDGGDSVDASKAKITSRNLASKELRGVLKRVRMDRRKVDAAL